jgi:hypothetical protein
VVVRVDGRRSGAELVAQAIEAHGGSERFDAAREIVVRVSSGGFAFASKLQRGAVRRIEGRVATAGQRTVLSPYPETGRSGVFERGAVRIESAAGAAVAERPDARSAFRGPRHALWWDRLDMLYFAGYALWTYLSLPFVLARPGYAAREIDPWDEDGRRWRRLAISFPADVHTHSREQVLYLDDDGLIARHDYTAEPFGSWAKAAHYTLERRAVDGLVIGVRRRAYPRRPDNRPRRAPLLVWIEIEDARLMRD